MKFFANLPKKSYTTPIGDLNLANFHAFYKKNLLNKNIVNFNTDSKTTLVEASLQVYDDLDGFWAFLFSNNKINPFFFNKTNPTIYLSYNQTNISFSALSSNTGYYNSGVTFNVPIGSILTEFSSPTGASWMYSSVGNFDLDGAFALVEKLDSYQTKITIKENKNTSGQQLMEPSVNDGATYSFLLKGSTYYSLNNKVTNKNTIKYVESISRTIDYSKNQTTIFGPPEPLEEGPVTGIVDSGTTVKNITVEQEIKATSNELFTVAPVDVPGILLELIVPNYNL